MYAAINNVAYFKTDEVIYSSVYTYSVTHMFIILRL